MCKSYRQLACDERCPIKALKSRGISLREIADQLDRSPATISREIARKLTDAWWHRIRALLGQGWSPEPIEGRLKLLGEETVGREWIYRQVRPACQPGLHSGPGGPRRASRGGGGEEPDRGLGAGHDHRRQAPRGLALLGGPDVEVHAAGAAGRQGRGAGDRGPAAAHGAVPRPHPHPDRGQRQGVRQPRGSGSRAGGGVLLRDPVPFVGARPERARQRPGSPVLSQGQRFLAGHGATGAAGRGPAEPPPPQGAGLPHAVRGLSPRPGLALTT